MIGLQHHRDRVVSKFALLLVLPLLVGCGSQPAGTEPAGSPQTGSPQTGGEITVALATQITSLDPSVETHKSAQTVQNTILEPLVRYSEANVLEPLLAESWEAVDATTWRITLRQGIKFSNGEEFNADAVKASVEVFVSSKGFGSTYFKLIKEVRVVDPYTVEMVTDAPSPILPDLLAFLYIYPPKYFQEVGADAFGQSPIGVGPYVLSEWVKGDHITVKRNPNYWGSAPAIDQITFRIATEDSTRVAMLQTGQADLVMGVPPQMVSQVEQAGARAERVTTTRLVFVELNRFDPVLQDVRLRKALNYATDKQAIIDSVFSGNATPFDGIIQPGMAGYAEGNVTGYSYDPDEAKRLMAEAGYPNGFAFDFYVGVNRLPLDSELADALVGQWAKVGISATLHKMEWAAFTTAALPGTMSGAHIISNQPNWWDPDAILTSHFWSKGTWLYANTPEGDSKLEAARIEMDSEKRAGMLRQLEKYWVDEQANHLILYLQQDTYGVSSRLQWAPRADALLLFADASLN